MGGGFDHTTELVVQKYNQIMKGPNKIKWIMEVMKENKRMLKNKIWMPVLKSSVPDIKPIMST